MKFTIFRGETSCAQRLKNGNEECLWNMLHYLELIY